MKAHTERKKTQCSEYSSNNLTKLLLNSKDHKLQCRQQQILNIVRNTPSNGLKKINLVTPKLVPKNENTISEINNNYKIKTTPQPKVVPKNVPKAQKIIIRTNHVYQKNAFISKETLNWMDKHYLNTPFTKSMKAPKNAKLKIVINKNKNAPSEQSLSEQNEQKLETTDKLKINENANEEKEKVNENLKEEFAAEQNVYQKLNQKEIIQKKIQKAIKEGKIFLVRADIPYLDKILLDRGWMKKYESIKTRHLAYGHFSNLEPCNSLGDIHHQDGSLNEKAYIFQELKHVVPNFIWDSRNDFIQWKGNINPDTYLNRLEKSLVYTSKIGLSVFLENVHWFFEEGVAEVSFPRCYNASEQKEAFIDDYRRTAAVSFIRWFVDQVNQKSELINKYFYHSLIKPLRFALERCEDITSFYLNNSLDHEIKPVSSKDWDWFIDIYIKFVHKEDTKEIDQTNKDAPCENSDIMRFYEKSLDVIYTIKYFDPQYELNGIRNIWILKPNMSCCGYGIMMTHKLLSILSRIDETSKNYFLIQKYIEKPLLVKSTKFDVRQWFLITQGYPLTIWVFKESLLRFSSRPFTFNNYHEIVHICNTAVQRKYPDQKDPVRSMNWNCEMINNYLKETYNYIGEPWYDMIFPKMCQAIVTSMLTAQDHIDTRENSFELYGADFVVMEDLSVWLIEINTNPRMHPPSSRVTERLYPEVLDSLIKVVFDYPLDKEADTGNFVLVYEQKIEEKVDKCQTKSNVEISLEGRKISKKEIFLLDAELGVAENELDI